MGNIEKHNDEIKRLEEELSIVAAGFRGCLSNLDCRTRMVARYHSIMNRLFKLGWHSKTRDIEDELPWNYMPEKYRLLHPNPGQEQFYNAEDYYTPPEIEYTPLKHKPTSAIEYLFQRITSFFKKR